MSQTRVCTCLDKEKYCKEVCACCYEEMLEDLQKQQDKIRSYRIQGRTLFNLGREYWLIQLDLDNYERGAGDVVCEKCRLKYSEHPEIKGWPTFVVTCDGRIWKL